MNQKLLIILITILNVFVFYLILTKKPCNIKENFQTNQTSCATNSFDCTQVENLDICPAIQGCRVINNRGESSCNNSCLFNPADADGNTFRNFGMIEQDNNGEIKYIFQNEQNNGTFGSCYEECLESESNNDLSNSHCSQSDCQLKCRKYVVKRAREDSNIDRSYSDYPTNRVSEGHYEDVRDEIIRMLDDDTNNEELKEKIRDSIYGRSLGTEISAQTALNEKAEDLNDVMDVLKDLNNTGNSFIQQVDQLGSFQDKYSQKLESLLESRRGENNIVESNLRRLNDKLSRLDQLYSGFDNIGPDITNTDARNSVYKSGKCLANSKVLNFTPVKYQSSNDVNEFNFYKNGAYLVNLSNDIGGTIDPGYLFIHPKKLDNQNEIFCNPNLNDGCKYVHERVGCEREYTNADGETRNAPSVIQITQNDEIMSETYPDNSDEQGDFIFKRQGMFNLIEITNNSEYNSIIIKTPNGRNNLVIGDNVKYPFGIIESLERPGYLVNILKNGNAGYQIKLFPASNRPSEKFKFSTDQDRSYANCNGVDGCR